MPAWQPESSQRAVRSICYVVTLQSLHQKPASKRREILHDNQWSCSLIKQRPGTHPDDSTRLELSSRRQPSRRETAPAAMSPSPASSSCLEEFGPVVQTQPVLQTIRLSHSSLLCSLSMSSSLPPPGPLHMLPCLDCSPDAFYGPNRFLLKCHLLRVTL